jgi:hypothetical protein
MVFFNHTPFCEGFIPQQHHKTSSKFQNYVSHKNSFKTVHNLYMLQHISTRIKSPLSISLTTFNFLHFHANSANISSHNQVIKHHHIKLEIWNIALGFKHRKKKNATSTSSLISPKGYIFRAF